MSTDSISQSSGSFSGGTRQASGADEPAINGIFSPRPAVLLVAFEDLADDHVGVRVDAVFGHHGGDWQLFARFRLRIVCPSLPGGPERASGHPAFQEVATIRGRHASVPRRVRKAYVR